VALFQLPCTLSFGLILLATMPVAAQEGHVKDSPLFKGTRDPKTVAVQIRTALPPYERALALLNASTDAESTANAMKHLIDAYHYLRGAHEGTQQILGTSKFPDPLLELQNRQVMDIRQRILRCTGQREYLTDNASLRATCVEGLVAGLSRLKTIVVTLP
jgi:hypothetical protein